MENSISEKKQKVSFEYFGGIFSSWDSLFSEAAAFASQLGKDKLITISHSEDRNDGIVTVWYWEDDTE